MCARMSSITTTTTGFRISDERWAVLEPLLPVHANTHRFGDGRPLMDRRYTDAILCLCPPYWLSTGDVECDRPVRHIHGLWLDFGS